MPPIGGQSGSAHSPHGGTGWMHDLNLFLTKLQSISYQFSSLLLSRSMADEGRDPTVLDDITAPGGERRPRLRRSDRITLPHYAAVGQKKMRQERAGSSRASARSSGRHRQHEETVSGNEHRSTGFILPDLCRTSIGASVRGWRGEPVDRPSAGRAFGPDLGIPNVLRVNGIRPTPVGWTFTRIKRMGRKGFSHMGGVT